MDGVLWRRAVAVGVSAAAAGMDAAVTATGDFFGGRPGLAFCCCCCCWPLVLGVVFRLPNVLLLVWLDKADVDAVVADANADEDDEDGVVGDGC